MLIGFSTSPFPRTASTRMALTTDDIRRAAERLDQAEKTRVQYRQPSLSHPGITLADAYAIQKAWIEIKLAAGRVFKGHKIGGARLASTSRIPASCSTTCFLIRPIETRKGDTIQADYGAYG